MIKSKQSGGMNQFLKKKDPTIEKLKEQYFEGAEKDSKSAYKPSNVQFKHFEDVEDFIEKQGRRQKVLSLR